MLKDGARYIGSDPSLVLIATTMIAYSLNTTVFNAQVVPGLGAVTVQTIALDCGNGQILPLNNETLEFQGMCLYTVKGSYPLFLKVGYVNTQTSEQLSTDVPSGTLEIKSAIKLSLNK